MFKSDVVLRAAAVLGLALLTACAAQPKGTYYADFSSSSDPTVALAASLMKMSLTFAGKDDVTMDIVALGSAQKVKVDADYVDGKIIVTRPGDPKLQRMTFVLKDSDTLQCEHCPDGMPETWKRQQ